MEDKCVSCGAVIPEGRQVCPQCERKAAKMESKRKYKPGKQIKSFDELATQKFVYIRDKIYHHGWWQSLQFSYIKRHMDCGYIRKAERVTEDG